MNNVNQLWMIEEMQPNRYEIVHANSTLVLEWMSNIFQLMFGKWKITQFFYIENAMTTNPWEYYIRESVGSKKLVYFD